MLARRIFFGFSVLVWLGYGSYCFFLPGVLSDAAGLVATTPTAVTEVRAMYGGVQIALGVMALLALARENWVRPALCALATVSIGLFSTRLAGALIDSSFSTYTNGALAFEFVMACWALRLLRKLD